MTMPTIAQVLWLVYSMPSTSASNALLQRITLDHGVKNFRLQKFHSLQKETQISMASDYFLVWISNLFSQLTRLSSGSNAPVHQPSSQGSYLEGGRVLPTSREGPSYPLGKKPWDEVARILLWRSRSWCTIVHQTFLYVSVFFSLNRLHLFFSLFLIGVFLP